MLELRKTLQKELVSAPVLPAASPSLPSGSPGVPRCLVTMLPGYCKASLGGQMLASGTVSLPARTYLCVAMWPQACALLRACVLSEESVR